MEILTAIRLPGDVTLAEVRAMQTPPISALVINGSKRECYKLIAKMIIHLNNYFGISWSDFQVSECSKEFYSNFFYWHQLDLKNFFRMCKQMQLQPKLLSVNQFSPIIFSEWAKEYNREWLSVSEEMRRLETDKTNYNPARETDIYNKEVRLKVDERTKDDRIQVMQYIIDKQNKQLENQGG